MSAGRVPGRLSLRGGGAFEISTTCDQTSMGECVGIVGSGDALGNWKKPIKMEGKGYPKWKTSINFNEGDEFEYKYCIVGQDGAVARWETKGSGVNRKCKVSGDMLSSGLTDKPYGGGGDNSGGGGGGGGGGQKHVSSGGKGETPSGHVDWKVDMKDLDDFGKALVKANHDNGSWRQKLEYIKNLFHDDKCASNAGFNAGNPETSHLAVISVFLHFLSTGQVVCGEDGRHFRPNHHAMTSSAIDEALDKIHKTPTNAYVIRKIRPLLPSYAGDYTVSVPFTRIRDIAHSNIPKDLKDDIKHNLQNKLHRCAGPEDLVTAERIWANSKDRGDCSGQYKEQMWTFMGEIREFFNAGGLEDKLNDIKSKGLPNSEGKGLIDSFLAAKHGQDLSHKLSTLVALRKNLNEYVAGASHGSERQSVRFADVQVEQYAFVLLAEAAKMFEDQGHNVDWQFALKAAGSALENGRLSESLKAEEASSLYIESLDMLRKPLDLGRYKAWLDRAVRLCTTFSDAMQDLFLAHVGAIGRGLGVDDHAAKVFVEAEVRASVVFQLSRVLSAAVKSAKKAMNAPPWSALQPGAATGKLVAYENIADLLNKISEHKDQNVIAFLNSAEGDEDIPPSVVGVVLGHELPLLSHLGVRARQQGVVFACSDGADAYHGLKGSMGSLWGKDVTLDVNIGGSVSVQESKGGASGAKSASTPQVPVDITSSADMTATAVVTCSKATESTCGAKCSASGEILALVEKQGGKDFAAPPGCALPFGLMMQAAKASWPAYSAAADGFNSNAVNGERADVLASAMRKMIESQWKIDDKMLSAIQNNFPAGAKVMVRSSANCEDLQKVSGAGLYDSIANVDVGDKTSLSKAVSLVWQSLWTKRAAMSRRAAGMKHTDAAMGVLVQQMVPGDLSFIAFSSNPITRNTDEVYVEMCVGMGETLASANQPGTPYRFTFDKAKKSVNVQALSSFSLALVPAAGGSFDLEEKVIDYSQIPLHTDPAFRLDLVTRIAKAVMALAHARGTAQDVEGVVVLKGAASNVHIVQARPMVLAD